jgi:hypothetical protein
MALESTGTGSKSNFGSKSKLSDSIPLSTAGACPSSLLNDEGIVPLASRLEWSFRP